MALIAGASQFINQATLANSQGGELQGTTSNSLLSGFDGAASILELGKQFSAPGIGLSASARAATNTFLNQAQNGLNVILSAGVESSIQNTQTEILAIQSRLPASSIGSAAARFDRPEVEDAPVATSENGNIVDTTA
jgi:hypothetical protein